MPRLAGFDCEKTKHLFFIIDLSLHPAGPVISALTGSDEKYNRCVDIFFEIHTGKITYTELQWNSWLLLMFHQLEPLLSPVIKLDTEVLCMFLCFYFKSTFCAFSVPFNSCSFHVKSFTHLYYFPHFIEWHLFAWIKNTPKTHLQSSWEICMYFVCMYFLFYFEVVTLVLSKDSSLGKKFHCRESGSQRQQQFIIFLMYSKLSFFKLCVKNHTYLTGYATMKYL